MRVEGLKLSLSLQISTVVLQILFIVLAIMVRMAEML